MLYPEGTMQIDFHYYATYCAAYLAGFSHEECMEICSSAQFTDCCSVTLLSGIGAPLSAATTQLQLEIMDAKADILSLQDITRIWASFHFLPRDLSAEVPGGSGLYKNKFRLICGPDSDLLVSTVELAKDKSLQAAGIAMHVLADTWAHRYFAGTPSMVINNTDHDFYELLPEGDSYTERRITFRHNPSSPDDLDKGIYTNTVYQLSENSVMCLGHGRAVRQDRVDDRVNVGCCLFYRMDDFRLAARLLYLAGIRRIDDDLGVFAAAVRRCRVEFYGRKRRRVLCRSRRLGREL